MLAPFYFSKMWPNNMVITLSTASKSQYKSGNDANESNAFGVIWQLDWITFETPFLCN